MPPVPPESTAPTLKEVIELSDDESENLVTSGVTASAVPSEASPSTPCVAAPPDTSGDEEFARQLFISLNREAIGIPGDGALVNLVSDEDYGASSGGEEEEGVAAGEEEKEEASSGGGSPAQATASPSPPPSA